MTENENFDLVMLFGGFDCKSGKFVHTIDAIDDTKLTFSGKCIQRHKCERYHQGSKKMLFSILSKLKLPKLHLPSSISIFTSTHVGYATYSSAVPLSADR